MVFASENGCMCRTAVLFAMTFFIKSRQRLQKTVPAVMTRQIAVIMKPKSLLWEKVEMVLRNSYFQVAAAVLVIVVRVIVVVVVGVVVIVVVAVVIVVAVVAVVVVAAVVVVVVVLVTAAVIAVVKKWLKKNLLM